MKRFVRDNLAFLTVGALLVAYVALCTRCATASSAPTPGSTTVRSWLSSTICGIPETPLMRRTIRRFDSPPTR